MMTSSRSFYKNWKKSWLPNNHLVLHLRIYSSQVEKIQRELYLNDLTHGGSIISKIIVLLSLIYSTATALLRVNALLVAALPIPCLLLIHFTLPLL